MVARNLMSGTFGGLMTFRHALAALAAGSIAFAAGAQTVAGLLSRQYATGSWMVVLYGGANQNPAAP